jgi:anti-sigma factor RsiW
MAQPFQIEITCRQVLCQISDYLDGDVSAELRLRLNRHFANCHHCSAVLDGTRNTVTLVADRRAFELPQEVSRRLYTRLRDAILKSPGPNL